MTSEELRHDKLRRARAAASGRNALARAGELSPTRRALETLVCHRDAVQAELARGSAPSLVKAKVRRFGAQRRLRAGALPAVGLPQPALAAPPLRPNEPEKARWSKGLDPQVGRQARRIGISAGRGALAAVGPAGVARATPAPP